MKNNIPKYIAAMSLLCMASACVTSTYVAPQTGKVAKLAFRANISPNYMFTLLNFEDPQSCTGSKTMIDNFEKRYNKTFDISADTLMTLSFRGRVGRGTCDVPISFSPKAGHSYLLDVSLGTGACSTRLVEVIDSKTFIGVPVKKRTMGLMSCEPLSDSVSLTGDTTGNFKLD